MPTAVLHQTTGTSSRRLQHPRPGSMEIKSMRKSKLMKNAAFKSMYNDIEKHQQDIKLAHLTGKPKDLMESTEKDAKFYNILSKLLCEVIQQRSDSEQKDVLQKVYLWYKSNRHVLYTGPRFGKEYQKKEAEAALKQSRSPRRQQSDDRRKSYDIVSQHSNTVSHSTSISQRFRASPRYDQEEQYTESCDDFSVNSVNSAIDLDLTTEVDYDEVLNRDSECGESVEEQEAMQIDVTQDQPPRPKRTGTAYSSPLYFKGRKIQQPVSRGPQKMVHSIASLVNPHLNTPRMGDNSSVADGSVSSVVFRPTTAPNSRADMLQFWQMFNKERTYGQDIIGKMNFVGRSGTGLDIRYNAHDLGEMPERKTKHVLKEVFKDGKKQLDQSKGTKDNVLTSQTLEEFYETADKFYPVKVPKLNIDVPRSGQSRLRTPVTPLGRNFIQTENRSPSPKSHTKSDLKLDTVVNMIDNVTDEMEFYKEKLIQPPALGFRRPAVNDVPVTPTPVMTPANFRTSSVSERFNTPVQPPSSLIAENTYTSNITTSTPVPQTPLPGIDWRGRITPEPNRYRSKQKFGNHTYVKKSERPSLRSAGVVPAGHRPKTAPGYMKSKWQTEKENDPNERVSAQASSHMTTSVNQSDLDNMMVIQHLIGDSASQGGSLYEFDMEFWRRMRRMNQSAGSQSTNQQLEYLSLLAAQQHGEVTNRSVSAPVGHHQGSKDTFKMEDLPEKMCSSPAGISSIGEYNTREINEVEEELKALHDDQSQAGDQNEGDEEYDIAISAIPSEGQGPLPANRRDRPLQALTISDAWQYSMEGEKPLGTKQTPISRAQSAHSAINSIKEGHSDKILKQRASNSKQALRAETYSLEYLPDKVLPKVERSAGRMPGNVDPTVQLMQMAQRQKASLHRTLPVRTPPSIPSPYGTFGARSPRSGHKQYQKELEEHARKTHSPRRFMQHVHDLRHGLQTAPAGSMTIEEEGLLGTLQVHPMTAAGDYPHSILKPQSAAPYSHFPTPQRPVSGFDRQVTFGSELTDGVDELRVTPDHSLRQKLEGDPAQKVKVQTLSSSSVRSPPKSIAMIGRPIAQVAQIPDPDDVMKATMLQKQMSAAVDIQRIFRGYVARENYKLLLKDYREELEDSRKAALQIQRHYRGHMSRKAAISNRQPNLETLEWARQYKQILIENENKRRQKREELAEKNIKNYVSAVNKLEVVGPHVDIYQVYHPMHIGASRAELNQAAVVIQKIVRGWLIRRKLERLQRKAVCYGSVFSTMVKEYKNMLIRVQKLHGIEKFKTPFSIAEMNIYLDNRRRYEGVFERRAFGGEIEAGDVEQYFKECDLFPSQIEIEEAREMVCRKTGKVLDSEKGISKKQILDMLYYIYVPKATGLAFNRKSTWMNPIIDGEEAKKYIGSHLVEDAPLQKCADLVIEARREERQREIERKKMNEPETRQ